MAAAVSTARITTYLPPRLIAAATLATGFVVGIGIGASPPRGIALLMAALYVPLAFINLPVALASWIPLVFVMRLGLFSVAPTAGLMLLSLAWLGTLRKDRTGELNRALRAQAPLLALLGAFLTWLLLSISWATDPGNAMAQNLNWLIAGVIFILVTTACMTRDRATWIAVAFVVGASLSVLAGIAGLDAPVTALAEQELSDAERGRFSGASGDPNYLAAGALPAVILLAGLVRRKRSSLVNGFLLVPAVLLLFGFAASESRGGMVAATVALLAAFIFFKHRRGRLILAVLVLSALAAFWFWISPESLARMTASDDGGNGRTELWQVALRMWQDHPIAGVGLNNYIVESAGYVREPGNLEAVQLIAERPHVAHNTYLQMLAETGLVGLTLFLAVIAGCLGAAWSASKAFARQDDHGMANLSTAALVAMLAVVASSFFLSNGDDWRLWVLLGIGPALFGAAKAHGGGPSAV